MKIRRRVKKRVSTASSQVTAASLDLFAPSRLPTMLPNISALHTSVCGYVSSLRAIHDFHHSRRRILWKDQRWSHGRKHNCKSWGDAASFQVSLRVPGSRLHPGGEVRGGRTPWGHLRTQKLRFLHSPLVCPSKF